MKTGVCTVASLPAFKYNLGKIEKKKTRLGNNKENREN